MAGKTPPTRAATTVRVRKSSMSGGQAGVARAGPQREGEQRRAAQAQQPAADGAGPAEPDRQPPGQPRPAGRRVLVGDDVHVEVAGLAGHGRADAGPEARTATPCGGWSPARSGWRSRRGRSRAGGGDVVAEHGWKLPPRSSTRRALAAEFRRPRPRRGRRLRTMCTARSLAAGALGGDPGGPADQGARPRGRRSGRPRCARGSARWRRCRARRGSAAGTRRRGRRSTAGRVRAAR